MRRGKEADARELLALGHRFAWHARGPLVLVVCGVAGSGKTTLARRLAEFSGWRHISSDVTQKGLAGLTPTERGSEDIYSPELTTRTYAEMGRLARGELDRGGGAILDATFHRRAERVAFRDGLGAAPPGELLLLECTAPPDVLLARAHEREAEPDRVSDADAAIVRRQLSELEPVDDQWGMAHSEAGDRAPGRAPRRRGRGLRGPIALAVERARGPSTDLLATT